MFGDVKLSVLLYIENNERLIENILLTAEAS